MGLATRAPLASSAALSALLFWLDFEQQGRWRIHSVGAKAQRGTEVTGEPL
jgi:hypothetical protein